ncbi:MAG: FecR domain-containing protein [Agriterribacter sp.]
MAESKLAYLFNKVLEKKASAEEKAALKTLLLDPENEEPFKALLDKALVLVKDEMQMEEAAASQILEVIRSLDNSNTVAKVVPISGKRFGWAVAAAIAMIVIAAGWWLSSQHSAGKSADQTTAVRDNDIAAPVRSQAVLTLSSGEKILLDSVSAGKVTAEGGVEVTKASDGRIVYSGNNQNTVSNTISLPKGSRPLQLVLADGSRVWLNAASSITYPTSFTGQRRRVEIQGEAYFEVSHDKLKPFIVQCGITYVEVLGTHFNVKAYTDEPSTDITLLEGSVNVVRNNEENAAVLLHPGQQAVVTDMIQLVNNADTESAIAWKNGYFSLKGADLHAIMRQISRWYNVEVIYEGNVSDRKFVGVISRDIRLSDLLQSLKEYGIEGRLEQQKLILQMKDK